MNADMYKQPHNKKKKKKGTHKKIFPHTKPLMGCNYTIFPSL